MLPYARAARLPGKLPRCSRSSTVPALAWPCLVACSRGELPHLVHRIALKDVPELQGAETFLRQPCTSSITACWQLHYRRANLKGQRASYHPALIISLCWQSLVWVQGTQSAAHTGLHCSLRADVEDLPAGGVCKVQKDEALLVAVYAAQRALHIVALHLRCQSIRNQLL